jgi:hypothetical protein
MIVRLLLLAALAFIGWKLWQSWQRQNQLRRDPPPDRFEPMARCQSCGVHLPARALSASGRCGKCEA